MKKIDFHVHICNPISIEETVKNYTDMCVRKGYSGVCILALTHDSENFHPHCNRDALEIKRKMKGSYAFASVDRDYDFAEQARRFMAEGFDGIKLLGGKPTEHRLFGYGYEHPKYETLFDYAEKEQIPLLLHNNDPLINWDVANASQRAIEKGWVYDNTVPSQKHFFNVLEQVLEKHPYLRAVIAHLGFYADNLEKAEELLEKYPNLMFDITPALIIYRQLSETHEKSNAFFNKFHDRLIFGTDADNDLTGEARAYNDIKTKVITAFLEGNEPAVVDGHNIVPVKLDKTKLENIYYNNAVRFIKHEV